MPDTLQSLADSVKINDVSVADLGARDVFNDAPFLSQLIATEATNGTVHKYLKEATAPTVGFRAVNVGIDTVVGSDTLVQVDLKYMDATVKLDRALATIGKGVDYQMSRQAQRNLRQALYNAEDQVLNGTAGAGFSGLKQALAALGAMCISAGGLVGAGLTSVYMVRSTPDERDFLAVIGNGGNIAMGEYYEALINEAATGRQFNGYVMPVDGWLSIQLGGSRSIGRLANVGTAANTTLTDDFLSQLFDTFPASAPPTHIVMNRRSRGQLQRSRSTVNVGGKLIVKFADVPTEWNGIPIICVESLPNNEAAVA